MTEGENKTSTGYQYFNLRCPVDHITRELIDGDARFLSVDKAHFGIKVPCPVCGLEMRLETGRKIRVSLGEGPT